MIDALNNNLVFYKIIVLDYKDFITFNNKWSLAFKKKGNNLIEQMHHINI